MSIGNSLNTNGIITLAGSFTTTGGLYSLTCTLTGNTNVTFPTTGTLITSSTFPVVGALGTIAISDGSNWINSTSKWPNTVGALGKIVMSDGTTNAYSQSTLPSYSGSVANAVVISDGTNYVLSNVSFPTTSVSSGKFIQSDGFNWIATSAKLPITIGATTSILISDGTDWVNSTSLWPNTVGGSGKIIFSNGTTNGYSTPTFPNTSNVSGALIISDGTNYLQSTSLWPNTVGSSGKVVMSNGTSNIYSATTFPSAAGAANTILISDGTNWITSTSLWPNTVGTASNLVYSNGTTNTYLATANNGTLITSGTGVPSISSTLPSAVQGNITSTGTVTSGTWNATIIGVTYGGTGSNLSATGGTSQVLRQSSAGAAITVSQLAASDLSNGTTGSGNVVLATSPTMTTPNIGVATVTTLKNATSFNYYIGGGVGSLIEEINANGIILYGNYNYVGGSIDMNGTGVTSYFRTNRLTNAERNALPVLDGIIIYNTDVSKFQGLSGGVWVDIT